MSDKILALELSPQAQYFPIEKTPYARDWMDAYQGGFAYRCLPMKIVNQVGWMIRCPLSFEATYTDSEVVTQSVALKFDDESHPAKSHVNSHFGRGVLTFSIPYLFKTTNQTCLWVRGLPNYAKEGVSFLEGIVETYWLDATFTYNVRLLEKNKVVRFTQGEPLLFFTTFNLNDIPNVEVGIDKIENHPETKQAYLDWATSRKQFNASPRTPDMWQKDYFLGKKETKPVERHLTQINLKNFENNLTKS